MVCLPMNSNTYGELRRDIANVAYYGNKGRMARGMSLGVGKGVASPTYGRRHCLGAETIDRSPAR